MLAVEVGTRYGTCMANKATCLGLETHGSNIAATRLASKPCHPPLMYVDGMGLYEYVGGNPLTYIDPSGTDYFYYTTHHRMLDGGYKKLKFVTWFVEWNWWSCGGNCAPRKSNDDSITVCYDERGKALEQQLLEATKSQIDLLNTMLQYQGVAAALETALHTVPYGESVDLAQQGKYKEAAISATIETAFTVVTPARVFKYGTKATRRVTRGATKQLTRSVRSSSARRHIAAGVKAIRNATDNVDNVVGVVENNSFAQFAGSGSSGLLLPGVPTNLPSAIGSVLGGLGFSPAPSAGGIAEKTMERCR